MKHPEPINREIKLNPKRYIVSKTDKKGRDCKINCVNPPAISESVSVF